MPRSFAPLRHRPFRLLASGQLASNLGDGFYTVALPWYVLSHHGGALLLGSVLACYGVARTASLVVGGHLSDRLRPWTVMLGADLARAILMAALVLAAATRPPSLAVLAPIAVLIGVGDGLFLPCSYAIIPALLPDEDLQAGNALSSGWTQLSVLVGPALGGGIVAALGPAPAFGIDGLSFVVSALLLAGVRRANAVVTPDADANVGPRAEEEEPSLWQVIRSEPVLRLIVVITFIANLTSGALGSVALPSLAHGPFHAGSTGYGVLEAAIGAGALVGTLVAGQSPRFARPAVVASIGFLGQCAFCAFVPYLGGTAPAVVLLAGFGGLNGFANVLTLTAFQRWARPEMLGRLSSVLMLGSFGTFPLSVLVGGLVVHASGPAIVFPVSAAAVAATVLLALSFRSWREFGATEASASSRGDRGTATAT